MPDVSRSDSQRSDASTRPRVSFNRDVHVKRIGSAGAPRVVAALAGDSAGRLVPLAVRRERPTRLSRRDLAEEAKRVLEQADRVACTTQQVGLHAPAPAPAPAPAAGPAPDKYSTLPPLRTARHRPTLKHNHSLRERNPRRLAKALEAKEGTSSSSTEREGVKRAKTSLVRSASDVGKPADDGKTKFWSLDRLRAKRNKRARAGAEAGSQSDVEKSPGVAPSSILSKRSLSDSERAGRRNSDSETGSFGNGKKKQLSPIIEVSQREDYFADTGKPAGTPRTVRVVPVTDNKTVREAGLDKSPRAPNRAKRGAKVATKNEENLLRSRTGTPKSIPGETMETTTLLHSSQTITKPVLTRGLTVDSLVRKLSQDRAGRGPPRVVSPLGLVGPGEDRQHNNNLPFSYTEPPLFDHHDGHVIGNGFAKVGATADPPAGGSPPRPPTGPLPTSEPAVHGSDPTQVIYAEVICNGGGKAGALTKQTVHTSVPLGKAREEHDTGGMASDRHLGRYHASISPGGVYRREVVTESRDYTVESRGRADGMDSRRNHAEDDSHRRGSPVRRHLLDEYESPRSYSYDSKLDSRRFGDDRIEPVLQKPRLLGNLDLSSRRDRLESRIESQRKDRLLSSRINESLNRSHQDINDSRVIDNHRKYPSNPRLDSEYNRREFLNSQLNYDSLKESGSGGGGRIGSGDRYFGDGLQRRSLDATAVDKYDKKDQFTDSGIDINYHGGQEAGKVVTEVRTFHNTYETTTNTDVNVRVPKSKTKAKAPRPTLTNVTKVDVNGHIKHDGNTDDEEADVAPKLYYNQQENIDQLRKRSGLQSTKLVQESKRSADAVPPSSVLIRHYAPDAGGRRRGDLELSEERHTHGHAHTLKRKCELDDIEETRRFLMEERRRSLEERLDDDAERRPEKVVQKKAKIESKTLKKKTGTMEKMKALFSRDVKKKAAKKDKDKDQDKEKKGEGEVEVDPLTARYTEYKGSNVDLDRETPTARVSSRSGHKGSTSNHLHVEESSRSRRERLPTPSPSPSRPATLNRVSSGRNVENDSSGSWFKSLDRLRGKPKPKPKMDRHEPISEDTAEEVKTFKSITHNNNNVEKSNKNLRFFGDTDAESVRSHRVVKPMTSLPENTTVRQAESASQQSSTRYVPLRDSSNRRYKSSSNNKLQVPRRRHHRSAGELATSSAESTTEGDSSQQSQRSVVYLHAATVGDIPGRVPSRTSRRARSREELSSTNGSAIQPATRTVSRSISVLAPWKPRHHRRDGLQVHYENDASRGGKPPKIPTNSTSKSTPTLNRLKNGKNESPKSYNTLSRDDHKDKENLSRKSLNSLNREGRRDKENYNKSGSTDSLDRDGNKSSRRGLNSARSIESLGQVGKGKGRMSNGLNVSAVELNNGKGYRNGTTLKKGKTETSKKRTELSRSVSMPKDSKVKSGWFRRKTRA